MLQSTVEKVVMLSVFLLGKMRDSLHFEAFALSGGFEKYIRKDTSLHEMFGRVKEAVSFSDLPTVSYMLHAASANVFT